MTRYQIDQLFALGITGISASQLLAAAASIFNISVGAVIFIPVVLGLIGWCCFEVAIVLRRQENPQLDEAPRESNLPFALLILVLVIIGGSLGGLWTD